MEANGSILLYAIFSCLAVAGAYLAGAAWKNRRTGAWAALATAVFFLALYWGLNILWRQATMMGH